MRKDKAHKFEYIGAFGRFLCGIISLAPFIIASFLMMFLFLYLYKNVYRPINDVSGFIGIVITLLSFTGIFSIPKFRAYFQYLYNALLRIMYSCLVAKRVTSFYRLGIKSQNNVISGLIGEISKGDVHIISIIGQPSSGKTTVAVLFVDTIGRDKNLSKIFAEWKDKICYVDLSLNGNLEYLLTNKDYAGKTIIFIDNLNRLSQSSKKELRASLETWAGLSSAGIDKYALVLSQFEDVYHSDDLSEYTVNILTDKSLAEVSINTAIDESGKIYEKITAEKNSLLRLHIINVYRLLKDTQFAKLLFDVFFQSTKTNSDMYVVMAIIIAESIYSGFVSINEYKELIKKIDNGKKVNIYRSYFRKLSRNGFLLPFPFIKGMYLFNEELAYLYRNRFCTNDEFRCVIEQCSAHLLEENKNARNSFEWLYFISCSEEYIRKCKQEKRYFWFDACINTLNLNYVLEKLEDEIKINNKKAALFAREYLVLCIDTGSWAKARKISEQFFSDDNTMGDEDREKIYRYQLRIIEATHGDKEADDIPKAKIISSKTRIKEIRYQAEYWIAHISMEKGDLSFEPWDELKTIFPAKNEFDSKEAYAHFLNRLVADSARTLFLADICDIKEYSNLLSFLTERTDSGMALEADALSELIRGHVFHYSYVYKKGLFGLMPDNYNLDEKIREEDAIQTCVTCGIKHYENAIKKYNEIGSKTEHTAKIRMDELLLCSENPSYDIVLKDFLDFKKYADENNVDVFKGYILCLMGKAYALQAYTYLGDNIQKYDHIMTKANCSFAQSVKIYREYDNDVGLYRSMLFETITDFLVHMNDNTSSLDDKLSNLKICLMKLEKKMSSNMKREKEIIEYLTGDKVQIQNIYDAIKYYPFVLQ